VTAGPHATASPPATPSSPPTRLSTVASVRNWASTSPRRAPIARRMPISAVRSRTATSITLAIPIPPTTRLIAAMAVIRRVKLSLDSRSASISVVGLMTLKSSSAPGSRLWAARNVAVTTASSRLS